MVAEEAIENLLFRLQTSFPSIFIVIHLLQGGDSKFGYQIVSQLIILIFRLEMAQNKFIDFLMILL